MSLMPNKTIRSDFSTIGLGAILLLNLRDVDTVSSIWERVKQTKQINTYEKFISGLTLLYILGAVDFTNGVITKK